MKMKPPVFLGLFTLVISIHVLAAAQDDETCSQQEVDEIKSIVSSEELILALTPRLKALNRAAKNLRLPSPGTKKLLAENCEWNSILHSGSGTSQTWKPMSESDPSGPWASFLDEVQYFEYAKFYFVDAELDSASMRLHANMGFKGTAWLKSEWLCGVKSKLKFVWNLSDGPNSATIEQWETLSFKPIIGRKKLFGDVTRSVIADKKLADELSESKHEDITLKLITKEPVKRRKDDKYQFFFPEVTLEHPAVSVVDFDRDGFDDFFLGRHHLPSLMFRNNGDGTFEEVGARIGLRLPYDCSCSLFADFDNDGDTDAFLGRARYRAKYFENRDGVFFDQTRRVFSEGLPFMTSSISSADYNNDGLLDVYFSTYSPIEGSHGIVSDGQKRVWPSQFLSADEQAEFWRRIEDFTPFTDLPGPPNLLLRNEGKWFITAPCNSQIASWRKTFQSMWFDFDADGDQDLYVCNDFAPDDLYRNDGGKSFVRINDEAGLTKLGFGMGVAGQDYDQDGDIDLYVSNMFSKAGTRITRQVSQINPLISQMAAGNYLYELDNGKYKLVSGANESQDSVAITGWSWGGRMVDVDNDGQHEIFVANGYYSAPAEVAEQTDL